MISSLLTTETLLKTSLIIFVSLENSRGESKAFLNTDQFFPKFPNESAWPIRDAGSTLISFHQSQLCYHLFRPSSTSSRVLTGSTLTMRPGSVPYTNIASPGSCGFCLTVGTFSHMPLVPLRT